MHQSHCHLPVIDAQELSHLSNRRDQDSSYLLHILQMYRNYDNTMQDIQHKVLYVRRTCCIATPISAGFIVTCTLACLSASIFSVAPPLPPAIIAPACPIRLPGGAVKPAINAAHGLASEPFNEHNKHRQ